MKDAVPQGLFRYSGAVLRREASAEGNISLYLLLKELGPVWVSAPGAGRGRVRFGGGMEPLSWGNFNLYKGTRRFYLKSVDVKEDFWTLRASPEKLRTLLEWDRLLCHHLVPEQPCDDLVALFYWSSLLIKDGVDPAVAEWRFLRKWLESWGLAPSLEGCATCGRPLTDGLWNADGLLCSECGAKGGGALLPESHRRDLLKAVQCPYCDMKSLFPPGRGSEKFWRDSSNRMKVFFDLLK